MLHNMIVFCLLVSVFAATAAPALAEDAPREGGVELARHDFPYASKYVEVHGARMHYVDTGGPGSTVVMIHGNPSWSYLWRNIIPHLEDNHRVIAFDLVGFGKSDKPDIKYLLTDHVRYVQGFFDALELDDVTLVIHDWGSVLGFNFAATNPARVKAIAFMEAVVTTAPVEPPYGPIKPRLTGSAVSNRDRFRGIVQRLKTPGVGEQMVLEENFFLQQLMFPPFKGLLTEDEINAYREPFSKKEDRLPVLQFPRDIPLDGKNPAYTVEIFGRYNRYLRETKNLPKLLLHLSEGVLVNRWDVEWMRRNFDDLTIHDMGQGGHFVQEHNPEGIGQALSIWMVDNHL